MEGLLKAIKEMNVNLDSQSLVEIARYWFLRGVIEDVMMTAALWGTFLIIGLLAYKVFEKFGTKQWNFD